jgi:DNA-directed RNA polymerase specialized sigma24 family protein
MSMPYEPPFARGDRVPTSRAGRNSPEERQRRRAIAARLSPQERLVVMLTYHDRLTPPQVAEVLGISAARVEAVRDQVAARCREMREMMDPAGA